MLTVTPSPATTVGLEVFANANISGGAGKPSETVTFKLFDPDDAVNPVFTSTVPVTGPSVNSDHFPTTRAATFNWVATLVDAGNTVQTVGPVPAVVDKARAVLSVKASPVTGGTLRATARLEGGFRPKGSITFVLTRDQPNTPPCSAPPVFTVTVPVDGAGRDYDSGPFLPTTTGTYRWRASYSGDANSRGVSITACINPDSTVEVTSLAGPAGRLNPVPPARVLDTRSGAPIGAGATRDVQVAGREGVPTSGAVAVVLNVTVTQPTSAGFLTVFPTGSLPPGTANLSFTPGRTVANLVVARLGAGGTVSLFNSAGTTHAVVDVAGWFSDVPAGNDGRVQVVAGARLLDTRGGPKLGPDGPLEVQVAGRGGVPAAGAEAVVVNLTVTNATEPSFLTAFPSGLPQPQSSNLNFLQGDTVANRAIVKLGQGGKLTLTNFRGATDAIVDVCGWFTDGSQAGSGGAFSALPAARILDTQGGVGGVGGPVAAQTVVEVRVAGQGGVPASGATAAVLNVGAHSSTAGGFLTVFAAGATRPASSDLNFATGEVRSNLVVVPLSATGGISLVASTSCHLVIDVAGFFSS